MGAIARIKGLLDHAAQTLEDIEEAGLPGNASKLVKSISQVMGRYAGKETEEKPGPERE